MRANFAARPQVFPWRTPRLEGAPRSEGARIGAELADALINPERDHA